MSGPFYFIGFSLNPAELIAAIVMLFASYALAASARYSVERPTFSRSATYCRASPS